MPVRIYQPSKTAMQSGRAKMHRWLLEFEPTDRSEPEPLMGWVSSADTRRQLRLEFDSKDEAIAYARRRGLEYAVIQDHHRQVVPKSYGANFAYNRRMPWTH